MFSSQSLLGSLIQFQGKSVCPKHRRKEVPKLWIAQSAMRPSCDNMATLSLLPKPDWAAGTRERGQWTRAMIFSPWAVSLLALRKKLRGAPRPGARAPIKPARARLVLRLFSSHGLDKTRATAVLFFIFIFFLAGTSKLLQLGILYTKRTVQRYTSTYSSTYKTYSYRSTLTVGSS